MARNAYAAAFSRAQGGKHPGHARRGNKFGAKVTPCRHNHAHASRAEARRCDALHLLERAGEIVGLKQQPQYWFTINGRQVLHENGRRVGYKADFAYFEIGKDGRETAVVEDVKGAYRDNAWTLRKAMFRALYPEIDLREVS